MGSLNTIIEFDREGIQTLGHHSELNMVHSRNRNEVKLRLHTGESIGEIKEVKGKYLVYLFDNDFNKTHFSTRTNDEVEKIKELAEDIRTKKIRDFIKEVPKYQVTPPARKRIRGRSLRMFQPIKDKEGHFTGEYWEMTQRQIYGRSIIGYRKVNLILGRYYGGWQYKLVA